MMVVVLIINAALHAQASSGLEGMIKLIPPDAQAALIVPNAKIVSDQITQCLEGMDRAGLLLGSRPIDQFKSASGFNIAVDDLGSAAVVLLAGQAQPAFLIPVTDAAAFLQGNFAGHEGDAYKLAKGGTLFAKVIGSHVLLSKDQSITQNYQAGEGIGPLLKTTLGERSFALLGSGDVFIFGEPEAFARLNRMLKEQAAQTGQLLPLAAVAGFEMLGMLDAGLLVIDFDPLGLVTHSLIRFKADSPASPLAAGGTAGSTGLSRLPNKPFYFAASIDIAGLGGPTAMKELASAMGLPEPPAWMLQAESLQFAAYPSPAGLQGGLLNDAVAVLKTPQPAAARDFIKQHMMALQNATGGIKRDVKWQDSKNIKEGLAADAYEIKVVNVPPELAQEQMAAQFMFGAAGWRGFVAQTDEALLMTFSQRPQVLEAALAASNPGKLDPKSGLAGLSAIKVMHKWMPPHIDIEFYLGVGQIGQLLKQITAAIGGMAQIQLPELDSSLPPIGFAADVNDRGLETATIVPAGVLAVILDQAMAHRAGLAASPEPGAANQPPTKQENPHP